ncbi:MAG: thioredoxin family protein [Burkholderiaceae bacterium]
MPYAADYLIVVPTRAEIDALPGATVVEFGAPWCIHCQRAQPLVRDALAGRDDVAHLKIEDGPGEALGGGYGVKLWPTLVFLRDGVEVARVVRPQRMREIENGLRVRQGADGSTA